MRRLRLVSGFMAFLFSFSFVACAQDPSHTAPRVILHDNRSGSPQEKIETDEDFYPAWNRGARPVASPDGKRIAFLRPSAKLFPFGTDGGTIRRRLVRWPQLWVKDVNGKHEKMLVDAAGIAYDPQDERLAYNVKNIVFSLDGKWIFFERSLDIGAHAASSTLYRVPADGATPEIRIGLTGSKRLIRKGRYQGDFLVSSSDAGGIRPRHEKYWIMDLDGKNILTLRETVSRDGLTSHEYAALRNEVDSMK